MLPTKTIEDAYSEGHDAAEAGLTLSANPYNVWDEEPFFDSWADGWVWQKREEATSRRRPFCRDCADLSVDGNCHVDGSPCDPSATA